MPAQPELANLLFDVRPTHRTPELEDAVLTGAVFGTAYLTVQRRASWLDDPGYDPGLDLVMEDPAGELVAFCVCWTPPDGPAELGTIGVRPQHQRRGLGRQMAKAGLRRLRDRGADTVALSTSSANAPMRALALAEGFVETRRTSWLRRTLVASPQQPD